MPDMSGPAWLRCLGELTYETEVADYDDEQLLYHSYRIEILNPSSDPFYNDRDWRTYRRYIRQEMHRRGLTTPTEQPEEVIW